ncbi:cyclic nucleotide-binding domain-containing protein 2 [Culex quinquefasciatus]|uniref:cyclic nucleotide-binding domain-containing protein 2 n=1 Tax=Culex quinquefasciatus TaxID=7176 RepID=UPI0018E3033E|nr:cyclic nucleotide-binding domain-containing protein 2 [Culex quinquefasciatus]
MSSKRKADEEKLRRRRMVRFRFRCLIRTVMCNNYWLSELPKQELGENTRRNIAIITRRKGRKGLLTIMEKAIMNQEAADRTPAQRAQLCAIFEKLDCLARFPPEVREELASCARYQYLGPGRMVLREGHEAHAVYFVLNGEITVSRLWWDPVYKRHVDVPCGVRVPGEMFGEIAFLYDCRRTATCTTATDTELLCVFREDFVRILEATLRLQWELMQEAIRRFQYFDHWSEEQIRECCILAKVNRYEPQQQIAGADTGFNTEYAYFVLSGQCMILQCLKVKKKRRGRRDCFHLLPIEGNNIQLKIAERLTKRRDSEVLESVMPSNLKESLANVVRSGSCEDQNGGQELKPDESLEHIFLDVGSFSCGSVFGLGEKFEDRTIVARNHVQCMLIPRYWLFMKNQNTGNVWQRIKMYLELAIPDREKLFKQYLTDLNWMVYRKRVVTEVIQRQGRHSNRTRLADVPLMCRVEQNGQRK